MGEVMLVGVVVYFFSPIILLGDRRFFPICSSGVVLEKSKIKLIFDIV